MATPLTHTPPFPVMQYPTREEDGNGGGGGGGGTGAGMLGEGIDANYAGTSVCPSLIIGSCARRKGGGGANARCMDESRVRHGYRLLLNVDGARMYQCHPM